jgi:hypothetical protein
LLTIGLTIGGYTLTATYDGYYFAGCFAGKETEFREFLEDNYENNPSAYEQAIATIGYLKHIFALRRTAKEGKR